MDNTAPLIIPNRLLPPLHLLPLPYLPLLLLRPPPPLLLPNRLIKLPLLLRPPRRPDPQRARNQPPRHRRRLLRPLIYTPRPRARPRARHIVIRQLKRRRRRRRGRRRVRAYFIAGNGTYRRESGFRIGGLGFRVGARGRGGVVPAVGDGRGFGLVQRFLRGGGGELEVCEGGSDFWTGC